MSEKPRTGLTAEIQALLNRVDEDAKGTRCLTMAEVTLCLNALKALAASPATIETSCKPSQLETEEEAVRHTVRSNSSSAQDRAPLDEIVLWLDDNLSNEEDAGFERRATLMRKAFGMANVALLEALRGLRECLEGVKEQWSDCPYCDAPWTNHGNGMTDDCPFKQTDAALDTLVRTVEGR